MWRSTVAAQNTSVQQRMFRSVGDRRAVKSVQNCGSLHHDVRAEHVAKPQHTAARS